MGVALVAKPWWTIAHEGGHALVAVLVGRGLTGIRLHPTRPGSPSRPAPGAARGLVLTFLGGYPAPSLIGIGGAVLVAADRSRLMLWIVVGALVVTLVWVRKRVRRGSPSSPPVCSSGRWRTGASPRLQDGFRRPSAGFLVFGGLRAVRELQRGRSRYRETGKAPWRHLRRRHAGRPDPLSSGMWIVVFWLLSVSAAIVAAWILLT